MRLLSKIETTFRNDEQAKTFPTFRRKATN